jgi:hypothetical protein
MLLLNCKLEIMTSNHASQIVVFVCIRTSLTGEVGK